MDAEARRVAEKILGKCSCHEAYTDRGLTDHNCAWHEFGAEVAALAERLATAPPGRAGQPAVSDQSPDAVLSPCRDDDACRYEPVFGTSSPSYHDLSHLYHDATAEITALRASLAARAEVGATLEGRLRSLEGALRKNALAYHHEQHRVGMGSLEELETCSSPVCRDALAALTPAPSPPPRAPGDQADAVRGSRLSSRAGDDLRQEA